MSEGPDSRLEDGGYTLILLALSLVALMVFTAFVVDLGGVYNARRQDQSAADAGALAGLQYLPISEARVIEEVDEVVSNSLGIPPLSLNWSSCAGISDDPTAILAVNGKNCITRNRTGTRLRVRVPIRAYQASFGRVVGASNYQHSAFAVAGVRELGFGNVIPAPIGTGAGDGDGYTCIRTGSPFIRAQPPCDEPESGQFGSGDFGLYEEKSCNGAPKARWTKNVQEGIDHDLSIYGEPPHNDPLVAEVVDTAVCPFGSRPNAADTTNVSGITPFAVGEALFSGEAVGSVGTLGRLERYVSGSLGNSPTNVAGNQVDDNPLWEFIDPYMPEDADAPTSCRASAFDNDLTDLSLELRNFFTSVPQPTYATRQRMLLQRCIMHYNQGTWAPPEIPSYTETGVGCGGECTFPVFRRKSNSTANPPLFDIQLTPRFAYVPELHGSTPNLTYNTVRFGGFKPVFMQRLYGGNCSTAGGCDIDFEPGVGYSYSSSASADQKAEGLTVFVIPPKMLPGGLGDPDAPFAVGKNRFIELVR